MNTDPVRNRPSEDGRDNDPNVRDYQGTQPGVSTISSSDTDDANQELTQTTVEGTETDSPNEPREDLRYDE